MKVKTVVTSVRKCGRKRPGLYLIGGESSEDGVLALFNIFNPPIPYQVRLHRSPRIVDTYAVMERQPMDKWWAGASKKTEITKAGREWALEHFGMTTEHRIHVGECKGCSGADEALALLVSKVAWNNRIADYFREITRDGIQELPRLAMPYNRLHEHLLTYTTTQEIGELILSQAGVWRIAYALPPSKRNKYIGNLARMLVLLGLPKDASALTKTFNGGKS